MSPLITFIRRRAIAGLLILFPVIVTLFCLKLLLGFMNNFAKPLVTGAIILAEQEWLLEHDLFAIAMPAINVILTAFIIFLIGFIGTNFIGRRLLLALEHFVMHIPLVKSIYGGTRQLIEAFKSSQNNFQRVVLVEYPRKGLWVMAFVAADSVGSGAVTGSPKDLLCVFVPTTPNPTSGILILVDEESLIELNYSIEDAVKFIVSSGVVGPSLGRKELKG